MSDDIVSKSLNIYFKNRPAFLGIIRCKEIQLLADNLQILDTDKKLKILDFGCGDGFFLHVLSQFTNLTNHEIVGVDISDEVFEDANGYGLYSELKTYDGEKLPFNDNEFDIVISNCVLEHVDNLPGNISEISRVMKDGAEFQTTVMSANWDYYLFGSILLGDRYTKWMRKKQVHKNLLSDLQWNDQFKSVGLSIDKAIGYIDKPNGRLLDLMHYLSVPSLFSKKLFKKWILMPKLVDVFGLYKWFAKKYDSDISTTESAAIYYKLTK